MDFGFGGGPGFGFDAMFTIIPILVIGGFLFVIISGILRWNKNNNSPVLTVEARLVAKRMNISHHSHDHGNGHIAHSTDTVYYATFQVESGDRIELSLPASTYGLLAEGDLGRLTFQGTRFKGFERSA